MSEKSDLPVRRQRHRRCCQPGEQSIVRLFNIVIAPEGRHAMNSINHRRPNSLFAHLIYLIANRSVPLVLDAWPPQCLASPATPDPKLTIIAPVNGCGLLNQSDQTQV